jgi:hypothetical protein
VEVAADSKYFDTSDSRGELPKEAFFTSDWIKPESEIDVPRVYFQAYTLPLKAWEALLGAYRLYYRLVIYSGKIVASPIFVMDLTGEVMLAMKEGEGSMRTDEALWRMPTNKTPAKKLRTKRSSHQHQTHQQF